MGGLCLIVKLKKYVLCLYSLDQNGACCLLTRMEQTVHGTRSQTTAVTLCMWVLRVCLSYYALELTAATVSTCNHQAMARPGRHVSMLQYN
jgi:hypothetical protein